MLTRFRLGNSDKVYALLDNVVRSLLRFAIAVALAHLVGKADYAVFVLATAVDISLQGVANSLLVAPLITLAPGRPEPEQRALFAHTVRGLRLWLALLSGVLVLLMLAAPRWEIDPLLVAGFGLSTMLWCVCLISRGWRLARFGARRAFWGDAAAYAFLGLGLTVVALRGWDPVFAFGWLSAAAAVLAILVMGFPTRFARSLEPQLAGRVRSMRTPMAIGTVANSVCTRIHPLVLAAAGRAATVADFGAASTLVGPMRLLSMSMSGVLRPRFSLYFNRRHFGKIRRALKLTLGGFGAAGLAGILVSGLIGGRLGQLVFGSAYSDLGSVLPWAAGFATFEAVGATLVVLIQVVLPDGASLATRYRLFAMVLTLLLSWPACAGFGAAGAFAAACAIEVGFVGALLLVLRQRRPLAIDGADRTSVTDPQLRLVEPGLSRS